jgi:hypothetical protein
MAHTGDDAPYSFVVEITEPNADSSATTTRWVKILFDPTGAPVPADRTFAPTSSTGQTAVPQSAASQQTTSNKPSNPAAAPQPQPSASTTSQPAPTPAPSPLLIAGVALLLALIGGSVVSRFGGRRRKAEAAAAPTNTESTDA